MMREVGGERVESSLTSKLFSPAAPSPDQETRNQRQNQGQTKSASQNGP